MVDADGMTPIRAAQCGAWIMGIAGLVAGAVAGPEIYQALDPEISQLLEPVLDSYAQMFGNGAVYQVIVRAKFYAAPVGFAAGTAGLLLGGLAGLVADMAKKWQIGYNPVK